MSVLSTPARRTRALQGAAAIALILFAGLLYWQQSRLQAAMADQRLGTARAVQALVEQQIQQDLDARAELIAGNQAFVGYVTQAMGGILPGTVVDTASIVDLLEERRAQLGLTIAAVIDGQGQLIASRDRISERRDFASEPLFAQAVTRNAIAHGLWVDDGRVFFVSMVPLAAYGSDAGFLFVGTALDDAVAKTIADTASTEVALFAVTDERTLLAASTFELDAQASWLPQARAASKSNDEGRFTVQDGSASVRGYVAPLFGSPAGQLVVRVPESGAAQAAITLGLPMILALALGVLFLLVWRWNAAAELDGQVEELTRVLERAASTGDYHLQVAESNAGRLAPLAAAFNRLMQRLSPRGD